MAFLPIPAPIALMLVKTIVDMCAWPPSVMCVLAILRTTAVALMVGLLIAVIGYHQIFPNDKTAWGFDGVFAEALRTQARSY